MHVVILLPRRRHLPLPLLARTVSTVCVGGEGVREGSPWLLPQRELRDHSRPFTRVWAAS